ncbi:MAG TPA: hypothetical protein VE969_03520 [Pyrinomonadaceae bacterium]|nr:hypothetical protein [Pyrinomonadaceae bacterium]
MGERAGPLGRRRSFDQVERRKDSARRILKCQRFRVDDPAQSKQQVIARDTIAEIHRLDRKAEKGKYAAIGAGIGTAAGGGIGGIKASHTGDDGRTYTMVGLIMGAGFGALGGLAFGAAKRKHALIYQAR